jgi:hypothetical protein
MEDLQTIALIVSGLSAFTAFQMWFYRWAYSTGHAHGRHAGFSEGLWKAAERESKKNRFSLVTNP